MHYRSFIIALIIDGAFDKEFLIYYTFFFLQPNYSFINSLQFKYANKRN